MFEILEIIISEKHRLFDFLGAFQELFLAIIFGVRILECSHF